MLASSRGPCDGANLRADAKHRPLRRLRRPGRVVAGPGAAPLRRLRRHLPLQGRLYGQLPLGTAPLQGAAESSAACGGESETEQVQRSQSTSVLQRAPCDAGTANRTVAAPESADGGVHCRFAPQVSCKARQGFALCFVGDDACIVPETLCCRKPQAASEIAHPTLRPGM